MALLWRSDQALAGLAAPTGMHQTLEEALATVARAPRLEAEAQVLSLENEALASSLRESTGQLVVLQREVALCETAEVALGRSRKISRRLLGLLVRYQRSAAEVPSLHAQVQAASAGHAAAQAYAERLEVRSAAAERRAAAMEVRAHATKPLWPVCSCTTQ